MGIVETATVGALAGVITTSVVDAFTQTEIEQRVSCIDDDMHKVMDWIRPVLTDMQQPSFQKTLVVLDSTASPTMIPSTSHRYQYLFVMASTLVNVEIPSLGFAEFTLTPGWTEVNFPDGSAISCKTATTNMIFRAQNYRYTARTL